jgi:hypothetical protein
MESVTESMPLCRALERVGLAGAARHLAEIATRPKMLEVKPLTRVRHCERALRCWIRSEEGEHIERAIAELLVGALTLGLNPAVRDNEVRLAPVGDLVQNRS